MSLCFPCKHYDPPFSFSLKVCIFLVFSFFFIFLFLFFPFLSVCWQVQFWGILQLQVNLWAGNAFPSFCLLYPTPVLGGVRSIVARNPLGLPTRIPRRVLGLWWAPKGIRGWEEGEARQGGAIYTRRGALPALGSSGPLWGLGIAFWSEVWNSSWI